ncbi:MAG: hypothetical protein ACJ8HQ_10975, partial [Chthoniobacterales bacterium]
MNAQVHPEQGAFFDLSARTKLRITGADRLRYVNGQLSNDLRKATETNAIHACVLSAKGKINADVFIHTDGDAFLVDSDPDVREQLIARLERYVIADDVVIGAAAHSVRGVPQHQLGAVASAFPDVPLHVHLSEQVA